MAGAVGHAAAVLRGKPNALHSENVEPNRLGVHALQRAVVASGGGSNHGGNPGNGFLNERFYIGGLLRVVVERRGCQPVPSPRWDYGEDCPLEESLGIVPSPGK